MYSNAPAAAVSGAVLGATHGSDQVLAFTGIALGVYLAIASGLILTGLVLRRFGRAAEKAEA